MSYMDIKEFIEKEVYYRYPLNRHAANPNKTRPGFIKGAKWMYDYLMKGFIGQSIRIDDSTNIISVTADLRYDWEKLEKELGINLEEYYAKTLIETLKEYKQKCTPIYTKEMRVYDEVS